MRDDLSTCRSHLGFESFCHTNKHRNQFVCFASQWFQTFRFNYLGVGKQLEPIKRFVQFLQGALDLAYKVSVRFCSASFAIVRANGRSGSQQLLTENLCLCTLRQSRVKLNDSKREFSRTLSKILSVIRLHPSALIPSFTPIPARLCARRSNNQLPEFR